jgi:hypothetical protein
MFVQWLDKYLLNLLNDDSSVINNWSFKLIDDLRVIIYDHHSVVDSVLFERMLLSQIKQRMLSATPNRDWQLSFDCSNYWRLQEILRWCWFRIMVKINPRCFLLLLCCSPSLPKSLSLCLTLSVSLSLSHSLCLTLSLSCLIPHHVLPVLISLKYSLISMFDYH